MILIYNLSGLLLGAAGTVVGIGVAVATGRIGAGLLAMAAVWLAFGWRRTDRTTGETT